MMRGRPHDAESHDRILAPPTLEQGRKEVMSTAPAHEPRVPTKAGYANLKSMPRGRLADKRLRRREAAQDVRD